MKSKRASKLKRPGQFARAHGSAALAKAVWSAAKSHDLLFEDIIGCCSILVSSVAKNSGEPVEYLLAELKRRMPPNVRMSDREGGASDAR